jgi:hypothetical protein
MDRHRAVANLPIVHAVAVRLRDDGADTHTIAVAVGVDDDQVPALLAIADAKLARLLTPTLPTDSPAY